MKKCLYILFFFLLLYPHFARAQEVITVQGSASTFRINFTQGVTAERVAVVRAASQFWADRLISSQEITVNMSFVPQNCSANSGTLGSAGANGRFRNFTNAPQQNVFYVSALANSYAGRDLSPSGVDLSASFNSSIDNNNDCLRNTNWDYSLSLTATNGISFFQTFLHELAHGLGFSDSINSSTGAFFTTGGVSIPDSYSQLLRSETLGQNLTQLSNAQRLASLTDTGNLVWTGSQVSSNTGLLTQGLNNGRVRIYAPSPIESGSSTSHFDDVLQPNELMEPRSSNQVITGLTEALMADIGWRTASTDPNGDNDNDAVANGQDNCPNNANSNQLDTDSDGQGNACDSDDDNDGISDEFEIANNLDPLNAADASLDPDNDGLTNLEEFTLGSDPNQVTFFEREPNDSLTQTQSLDGSFVLTASTDIGDQTSNTSQTIPHVTVFANGNNTFDHYSFTVNQLPAIGIFDIDNTRDADTLITLFDASGTQLAENDDAATSFGQGGSLTRRTDNNGVAISLDSFISFNFSQTGTYIIRVGEFDNDNRSGFPVPVINGRYQLQVSIPNAISSSFTRLDIDGNGSTDALTDGLLVLRYLFGFRGDTLINGAVAANATRATANSIETYLGSINIDIDGNGRTDALTDGLLVLRFLFGFRGDVLTNGAIAADAMNITAEAIVTNLSQ